MKACHRCGEIFYAGRPPDCWRSKCPATRRGYASIEPEQNNDACVVILCMAVAALISALGWWLA